MSAVDLSHLAEFEQEWVALTRDWKAIAHAKNLASLRQSLGPSADKYSYFFIPPSSTGYCGHCPA